MYYCLTESDRDRYRVEVTSVEDKNLLCNSSTKTPITTGDQGLIFVTRNGQIYMNEKITKTFPRLGTYNTDPTYLLICPVCNLSICMYILFQIPSLIFLRWRLRWCCRYITHTYMHIHILYTHIYYTSYIHITYSILALW